METLNTSDNKANDAWDTKPTQQNYQIIEPTKTNQSLIFYKPEQSMRITPAKIDHKIYHPVTTETND